MNVLDHSVYIRRWSKAIAGRLVRDRCGDCVGPSGLSDPSARRFVSRFQRVARDHCAENDRLQPLLRDRPRRAAPSKRSH
jgi:hypothetical protein